MADARITEKQLRELRGAAEEIQRLAETYRDDTLKVSDEDWFVLNAIGEELWDLEHAITRSTQPWKTSGAPRSG